MTAKRLLIAVIFTAAAVGVVASTQWLRLPSIAAPSPLFEALALAPPALTGPLCVRESLDRRMGMALLFGKVSTTCLLASRSQSREAGAGPADLARVSAEHSGQVFSASRMFSWLTHAAAVALADSVLRYGQRLRGARAIACGIRPTAAGLVRGADTMVQGWQTPDYTALVYVYQSAPADARGYSVNIEASRGPFVVCMRGRKRLTS